MAAVLPGFVHCHRQRGQALLVFLPFFGSELELDRGVWIFHRLSILRPRIVSEFLYDAGRSRILVTAEAGVLRGNHARRRTSTL